MAEPVSAQQEEPGKVFVYELVSFYCPKTPRGGCNQTLSSHKIISVTGQGSPMKTYAEAFKNASDGAPICPFHNLQMVPQLINLTPPENEAGLPIDG